MEIFNKIIVGVSSLFFLLIVSAGVSNLIKSIQSDLINFIVLTLFSFSIPILPLSFISIELKGISYLYFLGFLCALFSVIAWYFIEYDQASLLIIWLFAVGLSSSHIQGLRKKNAIRKGETNTK